MYLSSRNYNDSHRMKHLNIKKALAAWQELQPLSEKDRERLSRRFTVDFNYNSNHIEGNTLTLADMMEETGISMAAIQKLLDRLIEKKYVERGEKDGSWRVFVTQ